MSVMVFARLPEVRPQSMGASWTTSPRIVTAGSLSAAHAQRPSHQPALSFRRRDEARKQGMRLEWARLEFRVELHADEPGVTSELDRLGQKAVGRHAGEYHAPLLQARAIGGVDLVAVAVALRDFRFAIDLGDARARPEIGPVSAEPHGAAEVALRLAALELVAPQPFGHQADDRLGSRPEFGGIGLPQPGQRPAGLDDRHLHAEADAEIRHLALAGEAGGEDLPLCAA